MLEADTIDKQNIFDQPVKLIKPRLDFVDSLRGLAALYVIAYHLAYIPKTPLGLPNWLAPWLLNGFTGVTLFFVISAFTLCLTLDGRQQSPGSTRKFYIRRFFRIAPLYYVWLVLMGIFYWGLTNLRKWKYDFILFSTFTYNFFPRRQDGLVWASWTLGVEVIFYAVFPFIFRLITNIRSAIYFLGISLLLAGGHWWLIQSHPSWSAQGYVESRSIFHQLPIFAVGMVTYFLWKKIHSILLPLVLRGSMLSSALLLFIAVPYCISQNAFCYEYLMSLIYAWLFLGLSFFPSTGIINRMGIFLGLISYSLYLNHPRLIYFLQPFYTKIYALPISELAHYSLCLGLTIGPLIIVSYLTYLLIEKPCIALGRRFSR